MHLVSSNNNTNQTRLFELVESQSDAANRLARKWDQIRRETDELVKRVDVLEVSIAQTDERVGRQEQDITELKRKVEKQANYRWWKPWTW